LTATLSQLRRLQEHLSRADAAITPLAADGFGRDGHGGQIRNPERVLANALIDVRMAAAVAEEIENQVGQ
jgi:hypothetical protein